MTNQATVTIPYHEFQEIQEVRNKLQLEVAELKKTITEAKIEKSDTLLLDVTRSAIEIVRFAVASLPPESTKGWPTDALVRVASNLPSMPDATPDDHELSVTLMSFARECIRFEHRRRTMSTSIENNPSQ